MVGSSYSASARCARQGFIHRLGGITRDTRGSAAIEFALLSGPFLVFLCSIIQVFLIVWATQNLEESLQRAARVIYTGDFQTGNKSEKDPAKLMASLKSRMCANGASVIPTAFDCSALKLNVAVSSSFASGSSASAVDDKTGTWSSGFGAAYGCANPGDIVVISAAVKYPVAFGFLNYGTPSFADGSRLIQSTAVIRTEAYNTTSGSAC